MRWNLEAFEAILVRELERRGLTAAGWAKAHGISPGYLHELRFPSRDKTKTPSPAMTLKLADALGVPVAALKADGEFAKSRRAS